MNHKVFRLEVLCTDFGNDHPDNVDSPKANSFDLFLKDSEAQLVEKRNDASGGKLSLLSAFFYEGGSRLLLQREECVPNDLLELDIYLQGSLVCPIFKLVSLPTNSMGGNKVISIFVEDTSKLHMEVVNAFKEKSMLFFNLTDRSFSLRGKLSNMQLFEDSLVVMILKPREDMSRVSAPFC